MARNRKLLSSVAFLNILTWKRDILFLKNHTVFSLFGAASKNYTTFLPATIYVGVSKKMEKRLPKAYKFLLNWYIPKEEVSALIAELEDVPGNAKKDAAQVAKAWVESHPKIVNDWLKGIR